MITTAVIAEFNPFHNGHSYILEQARKQTNADTIVVIMSGDFVQRGEPAITDKYTRAKFALTNGADLVIELPVCYATASAEFFAKGAVSLCQQLGFIDYLCFGSEMIHLKALTEIAEILVREPEFYLNELKSNVKAGLSYPAARLNALKSYFNHNLDASTLDRKELDSILDSIAMPNQILSLEYIKALIQLNSKIKPLPIKRIDQGYHSLELSGKYVSASALRNHMQNESALDLCQASLPANVFAVLSQKHSNNQLIYANDLFGQLQYHLSYLVHNKQDFTAFFDITNDFNNKLTNTFLEATTFEDLCEQLKSKDLTYTRISRMLLHILLTIKSKDLQIYLENGTTFYAHILALNIENNALTVALKNNCKIPCITSAGKYKKLLDEIGQKQFESDLFASLFYESMVAQKSGQSFHHEFKQKLICDKYL